MRALVRLQGDLMASLLENLPPEMHARLERKARRRLRRWLSKRYEAVEARGFVLKVHNGFDYWFTFVTVPRIHPMNNRPKRALEEHVVQKRIMVPSGTVSTRGSKKGS